MPGEIPRVYRLPPHWEPVEADLLQIADSESIDSDNVANLDELDEDENMWCANIQFFLFHAQYSIIFTNFMF